VFMQSFIISEVRGAGGFSESLWNDSTVSHDDVGTDRTLGEDMSTVVPSAVGRFTPKNITRDE
jgi:hypothetical protein